MGRVFRAAVAGVVLLGLCIVLAMAAIAVAGDAMAANGAPGSAPLAEAHRLVATGRAAEAYGLLKPHERAAAGQADFDYIFGLAALDAGYAAEAVAAFERVLALDPEHSQTRAELGRAYYLLGDPAAARRELSMVSKEDVPPQVRAVLERYISSIDRTLDGGGTGFNGFAQVKAGYDSNASNSTADTQIVIPAFAGLGAATLSRTAREREAYFAELSAGGTVAHGLDQQTRLFATVSGTTRLNHGESDLNQANVDLVLGASYADPEWGSFSIGPQLQHFRVDGRSYRNSYGALAQWQPRLDGPDQLSVFAQYAYLDYPTDNLRNANRVAGGVTYARQLEMDWSPDLFVGLSGGAEDVNSGFSDHLDNWFTGIRAGGSVAPMDGLSVFGDVGLERREYGDNDPLFLVAREDTVFNAGLGAAFEVTPSVSAGPDVRYTRANSNIILNDYDRVVASFSVRVNF